MNILLVEDDGDLADLLCEELEGEGYQVTIVNSAEEASFKLTEIIPDVVISDLRLPGRHGMTLIPEIKALTPTPAILLITAFGSVNQAVDALKAGADDFLTKPFDMDHCLLTVKRLIEHRSLKTRIESRFFHGMLGESAAIQNLFRMIRKISKTDGPVLILGESGTGKELVAKAIHNESLRKDGPFLAVNCAGIPKELLESEFFGHSAGAYTGANKSRLGLLREVDGGTLLLDEIGEMPLELQAKLLRVLQEGTIRPVGSDKEISVDVRIITATHRDLESRITEGLFRQDLFFRLEMFTLSVPPLRERGDDLTILVRHFLANQAQAGKTKACQLSNLAWKELLNYDFPGNIRELKNAIERASVFCDGDEILPLHLPDRIRKSSSSIKDNIFEYLSGDMPSLNELQRNYIKFILDRVGGNKAKAADMLGITRRTLYRWIDESDNSTIR